MDNTQQNPIMNNPNPIEMPKKTQIGPVIGLVVILAIIVVGTLYFWGQRVEKTQVPQNTTQTEQTSDQTSDTQTTQLEVQSSSDEVNSIDADLQSTDFGNIDAGAEQLQ